MTSSDRDEQDWIEDFSGQVKTDEELAQWCARLSGPENTELRQLVKEAQVMRWSARVLLKHLEERGWRSADDLQDTAFMYAVWLIEARETKT